MREKRETLISVVLAILSDGQEHTAKDIASEINREVRDVYVIVNRNRRLFLEGKCDTRINSCRDGYTLCSAVDVMAHEFRKRLVVGMGTIINGAPCVKVIKRLAPRRFENLMVEYKPQRIRLGELVK